MTKLADIVLMNRVIMLQALGSTIDESIYAVLPALDVVVEELVIDEPTAEDIMAMLAQGMDARTCVSVINTGMHSLELAAVYSRL